MIGRGDAPQFVSNQVGEKQRKILRDVANNLWRSSMPGIVSVFRSSATLSSREGIALSDVRSISEIGIWTKPLARRTLPRARMIPALVSA